MNRGPGLNLREVAEIVGGRVVGNGDRIVRRAATLEEAGPEDLSLFAHGRYREEARSSQAGALLVKAGYEMEGRDQVVVDNPHLGLARLLPRLQPPPPRPAPGISPRAEVDATARLGSGVTVGPNAVIEARCVIGPGSQIGAGCFVGEDSEIGENSRLYPNSTVYWGCRIGARVLVHSGSVIGSDGFGFATEAGMHHKIPQVGRVVIEDDVEIGAGVTIDRGSIGTTIIGRGSKIDNLVQIGHNCRVGAGCLLVAQTGLAGSTRLGDGTVFAGQSGAAGHLRIGERVTVASKSAVYEDLPDGSFVAGIPAMDHRRWKKAQAIYGKLPELLVRVRSLTREVERLGERLAESPGPARSSGARRQATAAAGSRAPRAKKKPGRQPKTRGTRGIRRRDR